MSPVLQVDDFLMAGPDDKMAEMWERISSVLNIEDVEKVVPLFS